MTVLLRGSAGAHARCETLSVHGRPSLSLRLTLALFYALSYLPAPPARPARVWPCPCPLLSALQTC